MTQKCFFLSLSVEDVGDGKTLKQAIERLQELARDYGEDKTLEIEIDSSHSTFGESHHVSVLLRGKSE